MRSLRQWIVDYASGFDAAALTPAQADEVVRLVAQIEASAALVKTLAAARLAAFESWQRDGYRLAAEKLADQCAVRCDEGHVEQDWPRRNRHLDSFAPERERIRLRTNPDELPRNVAMALGDIQSYAVGMGALLIGLGVLLFLLALGLAFTIYGEISGVLGFVCSAAGIVRIVRTPVRPF